MKRKPPRIFAAAFFIAMFICPTLAFGRAVRRFLIPNFPILTPDLHSWRCKLEPFRDALSVLQYRGCRVRVFGLYYPASPE